MVRGELVGTRRPAQVRLRGQGGRQIDIRRPSVRSDSVFGVARRDTTRLPAAGIWTIAVRRFAWLRTKAEIVLSTGVLRGHLTRDVGTNGTGGM